MTFYECCPKVPERSNGAVERPLGWNMPRGFESHLLGGRNPALFAWRAWWSDAKANRLNLVNKIQPGNQGRGTWRRVV